MKLLFFIGLTLFFYSCKDNIEDPKPIEPTEVEWVFVEGGFFRMGDKTGESAPNQRPVHSVKLENYYISKYEITFAQYDKFCDETGHKKPDDHGWGRGNRPVILVDWHDANAYCEWIGARLPTEAEWEYAARGGIKSNEYLYSGSNNYEDVSWCNENAHSIPQPVGTKAANELDLYNMSGNVAEWCSDWFGNYETGVEINPKGPENGSFKVIRGGSCYYYSTHSIVSYRQFAQPFDKTTVLGFRPAKSVK